ncbi:DNA polymerase, beta domain protein region [Desulforamulus reducens MI-1]|uniref:DNA polymerase, beta domain protein region n=1 Tax=Desulforamulus reducens (strain ATCC BAA-1160 / DSM 100696 / MI-1) TaxID=349161 RepID=A4J8W1_DESRM|nr:nucleotidyltransferase domain-containing protein [Desulforamulus reducens]ABO51514.1 DNA polymerase, beta domain protein region [Desulforamulus reducens MI-1]
MAKKHVEIIVQDFIKALKGKNVRVEKAILYGSYAKGKATEDSDIDVAIISPDFGQDYLEEAVMLKEISEDIDLDISPRPYSLDEFKKGRRGQFLYDEIISKGKSINI